MNNNRLRHIIMAVIASLLLIPSIVMGRESDMDSSASLKSSYIFLEAQNEKSHDRADSYFDLLRYAYELDTTNTAAAFYLGHCMLSMRGGDKARYERGLTLIKKHFDAHPDDFYETTFYSAACMMFGHTEEGLRAIKSLCATNPNKLELQARLAEAYARTGDYTSANATLDTIELHHGQSFQLTSKKINNYVALNDTSGAIGEMHRLLSTAPRNASYNMGMAGVMQQFGKSDSALYYLNVAQEAEPENGYTYLAKAEYYKEIGDTTAYDQQIYHALTSENLEVESKLGVLVSFIREQIQMGDSTQRASELFEVLLSQHPHEADIHQLYSDYLVGNKDYKAAAEQQGYVMDINPTDAQGWHRLMLINMMDNNYPAAIKAAERALEYNPDSVDLYSYIAPAYFQMKEYDKALEIYDKAITMVDSSDVETLSDLMGGVGDVYFEKGDTIKAFETYEKALELNSLNVGVMNNYAYYLSLIERDLDKAERMSALTIKMYPDNATYLDTYAWVLFKMGDNEKALEYIRKAVANDDSPSSDLLEHYGDILERAGDHEGAVTQWKKAFELDPESKTLKAKLNQ